MSVTEMTPSSSSMALREQSSGRTPRHVAISEQLKEQIEAGKYSPGDRLPSEFDLGEQFQASRTTIRRAISNLIQQELVITHQGKGIFVKARQKISFSLSSPLMFFDAELNSQNHSGHVRTLQLQRISPSVQVQQNLRLTEQDFVFWQKKIIFADDIPIALDIAYFPEAIGAELEEKLHNNFTYSTLAVNGFRPEFSEVWLESIPADYELSEYLEAPLGAPLLVYRYVAYTLEQQPIVCGNTLSRSDRTAYRATITTAI